MGLAGVKKKTTIGPDPRNTRWIQNANGIGFKLLSSYGWVPGSGLGDSMTGRLTNIKNTFKDDTLGIGARASHAQEWSGLGAFNDIFARINASGGVELETDGTARREEKVVFIESKPRVGLEMRFVKGETYTSDLEVYIAGLARSASKRSKLKSGPKSVEKEAKRAEKEARRTARAMKREDKKRRKEAVASLKAKGKLSSQASSPGTSLEDSVVTTPDTGSEFGDPVVIRPSRFAHRAKFQRQKAAGRLDAASLAEILGVKA